MSEPFGQALTLTFDTFDAAGSPADPTAVSIVILLPDDTEVTHTWPAGDIVRTGPGVFTLTYLPLTPGHYSARGVGTGAVNTAKVWTFDVDPEFGRPAFATPEQLASTLGVATPTDELILSRWTDALVDASGYLATVIGQPVTAGTATLDLPTNSNGEADIWLVPVTSITSITELDTNVALDTAHWTLKDQRLYLPRACTVYRVVLNYGYATVPAELVRWTKVLAATQIQVAAGGSLGLSNVASVAVDDGKVTYTDRMAVTLPDSVAQWLKATFGGPQ